MNNYGLKRGIIANGIWFIMKNLLNDIYSTSGYNWILGHVGGQVQVVR
jgi:hypothetical protein